MNLNKDHFNFQLYQKSYIEKLAQVTSTTFSGLQRMRNSSIRNNHERHIGIYSDPEKRLSLPHAQVDDKCPDSSHSRLNRHCSTKCIENYDAVFVFQEFYQAVVGSLDQLSESRDGKVLGKSYALFESDNNSCVFG